MFGYREQDGTAGGDYLSILAPNDRLVSEASDGGDINDGSYVLLYRSAGGRILLPGDAHDATWEYVLENHTDEVKNCSVMVAPHHGRDSKRSYDFLDVVKPKLTLFGCAPSEHLAYDAWRNLGLNYITSNQAGNMVFETRADGLDLYIENDTFAEACGRDCSVRNSQGYAWLMRIDE